MKSNLLSRIRIRRCPHCGILFREINGKFLCDTQKLCCSEECANGAGIEYEKVMFPGYYGE